MITRHLTAALGLLALATTLTLAQPAAYDVVIRNGRVLDGTGQPAVRADVAIAGGQIAAIGTLPADARAAETIDAAGRIVAPGFIDVHSHAAEGLAREGLEQGRPLLAQGVTTIVANPDGGGPTDLKQQRVRLEARGLGPNVALLIGHGSVRGAVLGMAEVEPDAAQLRRMEAMVLQAMEDGAYGLSSGLFYAPGSYAKTEEVIALAKVVSKFGGVYTSHIRDESDYTIGVVASVDEVIRITEEGGVDGIGLRGIVSHMKALGPDNWGKAVPSVQHIEAARARGVKVFADQYPYDASSTSLVGAVIPRWAQVGGNDAMRQRIAAEDTRAKMLTEVRENIRRRGGPASLVIAHYAPDHAIEGKHLGDVAAARKVAPEVAALDLVSKGSVSIVSFNMSEDDIALIMRQPWTMTSSDGGLGFPHEGVPHPRNYGAFARKIARYVNDRKTVTLDAAVRSMTGLSAEVFGFTDRGVLRPGAAADVVIFDPAAIRDAATYTKPHQLAEGMWYVFVNGTPVIVKGAFTDAKPGRVLLKRREPAGGQGGPVVDHHQHMFSPALAKLISPPPPAQPSAIDAASLISDLDAVGIRRAVVLSTAYIWTQPHRKVENSYEKVKTDNDWTSQQVAQFPNRLIGFCGLNPLEDWAIEELARCAKDPNLRHGLKMHMGNSAVDYRNPRHVDQVRRVFRAANGYRMPIVVHVRASLREKRPYGREEALVFLNELVSAAPDVVIQIAHLAGAGGYSDPLQDQALMVFVEAIERGDPRTKQLWFDVSGVTMGNPSAEDTQRLVTRMRQLGMHRLLYGSDAPVPGNSAKEHWTAFRKLPLTDEEFRTITSNVAPYLR